MKGDSVVSFIKLAGTTFGTGVATSPFFQLFTHYISTPVWGVPVTTVGAAAAGACLSLCFGDPVPTRRSLFGQVIASTVFGAAIAVLVADGMAWEWATKNISMFALMTAAIIRWFLPTTIERGKQLIKEFRIPFTKKNDGGNG